MKANTAGVLFPVILTTIASAELARPVRILEHDIPHAAPFVADIDGDGRQDLLVGHFRVGPFVDARVKVYRNVGTKKAPRFDDGDWLVAGDADASVDEFCYTGFGPQVLDFNGDGIRDLISGSRNSLLHVFAGGNDGSLNAPTTVQYVPDEGARRNFAYNSRIFAHDWDSDGDFDLLAARYQAIWLIRNEGDTITPRFALPRELVKRTTRRASLCVASVADWNNDGPHDLIIGRSDGSVVWHRNDAEIGAEPSLGPAQILVNRGLPNIVRVDFEGNYESPHGPTTQLRLCIADINDDGHKDLLIGDTWRAAHSYDAEHPRPERTAEQKAAYANQQRLKRDLAAFQVTPPNESEQARVAREAKIAATKLEGAEAWQAYHADYRASFNRHGSVWLFERVAP